MPEFVTKDTLVDVVRREQQKGYYCGPACCQMFSDRFGLQILQSTAYDHINQNRTEALGIWHSDPDGIASYLNFATGAVINFVVDDYDDADFKKAIARLYYTLSFLQIPALTLINQGYHWVIVKGLREAVYADGTHEIIGVYIIDPFPTSSRKEAYLSASEFEELFTPIIFGSKWLQKRVLISDNSEYPLYSANLVDPSLKILNVYHTIEDTVSTALQSHGFLNSKIVVRGGGAPLFAKVLVKSLEPSGRDYTISPIDAVSTKEFRDYIYVAIEEKTAVLLEIVSVIHALEAYTDIEANIHARSTFPDAVVTIETGYYWKRCEMLRSRFDVARLLNIDGERFYLLPNGNFTKTLDSSSIGGS